VYLSVIIKQLASIDASISIFMIDHFKSADILTNVIKLGKQLFQRDLMCLINCFGVFIV